MPKEPQSYGSQGDWVGGNVGEGGGVSDLQVIDDVPDVCAPAVDEDLAAKKVTDQDGGAKRSGFFKKRDY
ncbi:MAG TPA: hypothetical protein VF980_08835 [Thermoanaerobaculia bacterium]